MSQIESRNYRYAHLLWEFWKRDAELFVESELEESPTLETKPHAIIFVFDGSLDKVPNGDEEVRFYSDVIKKCQDQSYFYPQIVLTRVDRLEDQIKRQIKKGLISANDWEISLKEIQDKKIEDVAFKLGVPRASVHFIENYHDKITELNVSINYYALKLLEECLKECDKYIHQKLPENSSCSIF